jgi:hypothetical protein
MSRFGTYSAGKARHRRQGGKRGQPAGDEYRRVPDAFGEPHAQRQRRDRRDADHDAVEAQSLPPALGRDELRHQRAADDDRDPEPRAAGQADDQDRGHGRGGAQGEGRRAEQHQARGERRPVPEAGDQAGSDGLGGHCREHQRAGGEARPGPADADGRGVERNGR